MSDATPLRESLKKHLKESGMEPKLAQQLAKLYWSEVVGAATANHTRVRQVRDGVLYLDVDSSAWAQDINLMKGKYVEQLNRRLGKEAITDIRIRVVGELKDPDRRPPRNPSLPSPSQLERIKLSEGEMEKVEDMVAPIQDEELRDLLKRIITKEFKANRWKEQKGFKRCPQCGVRHNTEQDLCPVCWSHSLSVYR